ncbi:hypothetical protein J7E87_23980 [Streptomyces sp. ISL-1]|uniref:hypothetical protein n=1 Tax=Streptomyces sp. ISL-1 TaxID=2817657 RepID=UPI001BE94743|nr:hypothetical protein [Streptomyces sp. ISL-1]MBT2392399.1 hypothetical protein [Streptomyces sp. ISL-1]
MTLTYHDIMTADLSRLSGASKSWKKMGDRFGALQINYNDHVRGLSDGTWRGVAFEAYGTASSNTHFEFGAAKNEAHAISSILDDAHTQLTSSRKALSDYVDDLLAKGYKVSAAGEVTFEAASPEEKRGLVQSGSWSTVMDNVAKANAAIKKSVKDINDFDAGIKIALEAAVVERQNKGAPGGFNADAKDVIPKAPPKDEKAGTKTDGGWNADGKSKATGPDAGFSATGPAYGKEGMLKAYGDLFHVTAEGEVTNGDFKLSGVADGYGGARATGTAGFSQTGASASVEASAGVRALAEGRAGNDFGSVYARGTGFAGAEAGADFGLGADGFNAEVKAFAGAKAGGAPGVEAGGIGIGVTGEAWAGAGVEGDLIFGERNGDGKFHIGAELGAAPGLGGKLGMEFTVDPGKVVDTAKDAGGALKDLGGDVVGGVKSLF